MDYNENPVVQESNPLIENTSREWSGILVNTGTDEKTNVNGAVQTNTSAKAKSGPTEQPNGETEQVTIQLFKQISICGTPSSVRLDSWTSVQAEPSPNMRTTYSSTSPQPGGEWPPPNGTLVHGPDSMLQRSDERVTTPFESVEFFPKPVKQERRARQKQLMSQPIYESLPNPCHKVRRIPGDPLPQSGSKFIEVREEDGATKYKPHSSMQLQTHESNIYLIDAMLVPNRGRSQTDPGILAFSNSTSITGAIYTNTPSIPTHPNFMENTLNMPHSVEPDAQIHISYVHTQGNTAVQCTAERPNSIPSHKIPRTHDSEENEPRENPSEISTDQARYPVSPARENASHMKYPWIPNVVSDESFSLGMEIQGCPDTMNDSPMHHIHLTSMYPESPPCSLKSDVIYLVPKLTMPHVTMLAYVMRTPTTGIISSQNLNTDPFQSNVLLSVMPDENCSITADSRVSYEIPMMLYTPIIPQVQLIMNVSQPPRSVSHSATQTIQPNRKNNLAGSESTSISTSSWKPTKINNIQSVQSISLEWVLTQIRPGYSIEIVGNSIQLLLESAKLLHRTNSDFHPMGASSSYSEVPKTEFPIATTATFQDFWSAGENIYHNLSHYDIQYLHGVPDNFIYWIQEPFSFIPVNDVMADQEETSVPVTPHQPHNQPVAENIPPQIISVAELDLIFMVDGISFGIIAWSMAGESLSYSTIYYQVNLSFNIASYFVPRYLIDHQQSMIVDYQLHQADPSGESQYSCQPNLCYGIPEEYTDVPPIQLFLQIPRLATLDGFRDLDRPEPYNGSEYATTEPNQYLTSLSDVNSETTTTNRSKNVFTSGQQMVTFNVIPEVPYPNEITQSLASIGFMHVIPVRTPDVNSSRATYTNLVLEENGNPNSLVYPARTDRDLVRIRNPPKARSHSQPNSFSRYAPHTDRSTTQGHTSTTDDSGGTQQFKVTTERVNRYLMWDWDRNFMSTGQQSPEQRDFGRVNMRDAYEMHREVNSVTHGFEPQYPMGEVPSITINLTGQPGMQYEMKIGDPSGEKVVGIKTYPLPPKQETSQPSTRRDMEGQRPKKMCMPLPRFLKKKSVPQEASRM